MYTCKCNNCNANLRVEKNDILPGCREMEEVYCPNCFEIVDRIFTSGIPTAEVTDE